MATRFTSIKLSSTRFEAGTPLTVTVNASGFGKCEGWMRIDRRNAEGSYDFDFTRGKHFAKGWPRTDAFMLPQGHYRALLLVAAADQIDCGYTAVGSIPGDMTEVDVITVPK